MNSKDNIGKAEDLKTEKTIINHKQYNSLLIGLYNKLNLIADNTTDMDTEEELRILSEEIIDSTI